MTIKPLSEDEFWYECGSCGCPAIPLGLKDRLRELFADTMDEINAAIQTAHLIENEDILLTLINIKDSLSKRFAPLLKEKSNANISHR